jgi:hypothetical protein
MHARCRTSTPSFLPLAVRGDVPKDTSEIFFRKVKFWNQGQSGVTEPPPVFVRAGCGGVREER